MGLNYLCGLALDNRKIAKPLSFDEGELLTLAGYLSPHVSTETGIPTTGLDPYVAKLLASEPAEVQRTVIGILSILKSVARAKE